MFTDYVSNEADHHGTSLTFHFHICIKQLCLLDPVSTLFSGQIFNRSAHLQQSFLLHVHVYMFV